MKIRKNIRITDDAITSMAMKARTIVFNDVEMETTDQGCKLVFPEPVFMSKDEEILVRYNPDTKVLTVEVYTCTHGRSCLPSPIWK